MRARARFHNGADRYLKPVERLFRWAESKLKQHKGGTHKWTAELMKCRNLVD